MNCGESYEAAMKQARANASLAGESRYIHRHNAAWYVGKSPLSGPMATLFTEIKPDGTCVRHLPATAEQEDALYLAIAGKHRKAGAKP